MVPNRGPSADRRPCGGRWYWPGGGRSDRPGVQMAIEHGRPTRGGVVFGRVSGVTGAVLAVLAVNVALIVAGLAVVSEGRRPALWAGLAAITVQCAVAVAALAGPMALDRRPRPALTCLLPGALFAIGYVSLLGLELAGFKVSFDRGAVTVYAWFAVAAGLGGALSGFLLQDMYGAMVAHQLLSVVIGLAAGLAGGAIACAAQALPRPPPSPRP